MRSILLISFIFFSAHIISGNLYTKNSLKNSIRLYARYFSENLDAPHKTPFDMPAIRTSSLENFMHSWLQRTRHPRLGISEKNLVLVAFLYLRRLKPHTITSDNIVNLTLIALILATKYGSDYIYHDSYYARVSHIPLPTLGHLQWVFLSEIDYRLFVSPEDLKEAQNLLRESALGKIGI